MTDQVVVVGAGLAGSEAAWQLAESGIEVKLVEMRPETMTPAHLTGLAAEMVCSNSFKSDDPFSATGILKAELRRMDSLVLRCADDTRVPAGNSLAVDRDRFSVRITECLRAHPKIQWSIAVFREPDPDIPTILATGPLTADPLAEWLKTACGCERLFFYDAIAPIITIDSIDMEIAFRASRYGKGGADFINCPLSREEYGHFVEALIAAPMTELHDFEVPYFEGCLPIEVMARRGVETLRHGPMKPVGLDDPRTGRWPHAIVQLRQDTIAGDLYNMVGFQTRMKWSAQKDVFRMIPGLEKAEFARFGSIHRNTYLCAPEVLDEHLAFKHRPNLWVAGQLAGVEGYLESAAAGLAAALSVRDRLQNRGSISFPRETMLGALLHYLAHASSQDFAPMNAVLGLLPALPDGLIDKRAVRRTGGPRAFKQAKGQAHRDRALSRLEGHMSYLGELP